MTDDLTFTAVPGADPGRPVFDAEDALDRGEEGLDPADALASLPLDEEDDGEEGFTLELDEIGRPRVPDWVAGSEPEDLALALESVCFVLNRPVTLGELSGILGQPSQRVEIGRASCRERV